MRQISELRLEHEAAERKRSEIDKVALILGLDPSDRPRRAPTGSAPRTSRQGSADEKQSTESRCTPNQDTPPMPGSAPSKTSEKFEYYDPGEHWCKNCNVTTDSMFVFFTHLQGKGHRKTQDPYDRPWAPPLSKTVNVSSGQKITKPAQGSEFLLPVRGFYCRLCKEFYGDAICAEEHVTTHAHNEKYKLYVMEKPLYEQRRNLEQQAGLTVDSDGKKRKHMEGPGDDDESKHKKDKKDREPKRAEEEKKDKKVKPKKEEVEEKYKSSNKVEASKKVEEEKAALCKMAEDEKHRSMKDERQRYSREEDGDGPKYIKRVEAEKYKYSREDDFRHRYRQDEDRSRSGRGEERPRYNDDRYRSNRYPESRSKYDRDREEPKAKIEKETKTVKRQFKEEAEVKKPEPPPKPYDPPKIMCGPSPAMRAKLRKQSLESAKAAAPVALSPPAAAFGRFTWKKKENVLAKEAERVAAEFLKDDEAPTGEKIPVEDSFAKSMAVAKEIALKLSGQPSMPPPWAGQVARGRIRPNLPAPAVGPRKSTTVSKATRTVFVKPPPFMNTGDGAHRSEKLKTHLAAAKAKDLFDIFYSGRSQSESESKSVLEHEDADEPETGPSLEALMDPQAEEMLLPSDDTPNPETPDIITPETLGLPSDMMSLGFEYDFNF
ncbi:hypothetical protein CRUP_026943, partial [Coryphaenoides rupestris]